MSWAKLDDRFHAHPKVLRAMHAEPGAVALHVLAMSYTAAYELDGQVPVHFVTSTIGDLERAKRMTDVLEDAGLWRVDGSDGWEINDFTEYNPSRAELEKRRQARARAGRKAGRASGRARKANER